MKGGAEAVQPPSPVVSPDAGLRAFLQSEGYVFEDDWRTLQQKITQRAEAPGGSGHAKMFERNLGGRTGRHHNMRTGVVDVLAQFMASEEEANLLISVYGEEVLAGYSEVLRVLKESGGVGRVVEFGAWTGSFGRYLLGKKMAKTYVGFEAADCVVALVAGRRSPKAFHLQTPHGRGVENVRANWLVCTLGLHRRSDYFFDEDGELTPLPIEYQDERVVAQAKEYYTGLFASVASVVRSNTVMVITQPVRNFAEVWGVACAARDAGWSLAPEKCRCVWGGRRFATLVLQRGEKATPMKLPDAACWWGALVSPFSTSMNALSDVALGQYFALEDRHAVHSGQLGRSAVEVGLYKKGAYAIHSASPVGFTLFTGASEREVHNELEVYCDAHGEILPDEPWPVKGVIPSASELMIAEMAPSEQTKAVSPLSKKAAMKAQREDLQKRVIQARALDLNRLRELGAVFPPSLEDAILRKLDEAALWEVEEQELRRCVTQTLKALDPDLYKQLLIDEIVAARVIDLCAMNLSDLRTLHAAELGVPHERKNRPDRKTCVRKTINREEAKLRESAVSKIEDRHRRMAKQVSRSELVTRFVDNLWYIDAKVFLHEHARRFETALASPPSRDTDIKTSLCRWLREEKAKLADANATMSDPELLNQEQAVVEDLAELLIEAKDSKKGNRVGRIRLSEKERAEFEERWRCDAGIQDFSEAISRGEDVDKVENLHRCYDALHRLVEGARTGVEDWEKKMPKLAVWSISRKILRIRNMVRVYGIGSDGKAKGDGRGARLLGTRPLPQSDGHITAIHVVQEGLLVECGKALDVATIRRLLKDTSTPLAWFPGFLLWRTWRRAVEQGRSSICKLRVDFDQQVAGIGVSDDAIHAVRQFLLRCEFGFLHMLNRYPDRTPVKAQATRAIANLSPRKK